MPKIMWFITKQAGEMDIWQVTGTFRRQKEGKEAVKENQQV